MTPSCTGIDMLATTSSSSTFEPRNRIFANAKPARDENTSTDSDTVAATIALFTSAFVKLAASLSKTARTFSIRWPPGTSGGGPAALPALVVQAAPQDRESGD